MGHLLNAVGMDTTTGQFGIAGPADTAVVPSLQGSSGTPTLVAGSAAGTGPTLTITGNNLSGKISLTVGTGLLATGTVLTLTLANGLVFPNGMAVIFGAQEPNFASVITKLSVATTTSTAVLSVGITALVTATTYVGFYSISGW